MSASGSNYVGTATEEDDRLVGGSSADFIEAGGGNDSVSGGSGSDILDGGSGLDRVLGGSGADTLIFRAWENEYDEGGSVNGHEVFTGYDVYDGGNGSAAKGTAEIDTLKIYLSAEQIANTDFMAQFNADLLAFNAFILENQNTNTLQAGQEVFTFKSINLKLSAIEKVTVDLDPKSPTITSDGGGATASVSVAENSTAVTTVTATDPDAFATQTYSISGGVDAALFAIDATTGALSFIAAPNFEAPGDAGANNIYDVQVTVTDGSLTDTQDIAVTVTNVNESPTITSDGGGATASVSVAENSTAVTTVTATDPDAFATQTYSISGGADAALFAIDATTGALSFIAAPNFEAPGDAGANNIYDVQVTVTDGSLTDTQDIAVTVTNVNESPTITSDGGGATASVSVAENSTAVTTVTATDPDAFATQTYSISGGVDAALFAIDATTGALSFIAAPNFEAPGDAGANNIYDVQVTVTDGSLTDTQDIAVTVDNVNESPTITSDGGGATASVSVAENSTAVTTVTATDPDAFATQTYSISGGADAALFAIDATTGALSFIAAPNFEAPGDAGANNIYDVQVTVTDGSLTDTQDIAVTVTNVNESPTITSDGGGATASVSVAENSTAVTTVTATDPDAFATQTYSISGGVDAALFAIDATTGALSFIAAPNFEAPGDAGANNIYDVQVTVTDGSLTDTQDIAVTVTNVNESPTITSDGGGATASVSVAENSTAVTTVTATDPDAFATQTYSISGGADAALFAIDATTGALSFIAAPNFEAPGDAGANNIYDVQVTVTDGSLTDTQDIAVTVTNVNESPVNTVPAAQTADSNTASAIAGVSVTDVDSPNVTTTLTVLHGKLGVTGSGVTGNNTNSVTVNGTIAQVNAALSSLSYVSDLNYNGADTLTVLTSDGALSDTDLVAITVNAPTNQAPTGIAFVPTSSSNTTNPLGHFAGIDPNSGNTFTYSATTSNAGISVDSTGNLTVAGSVTLPGTYTLDVTVTDQGGLSSSTVHFTLLLGSNGNTNDPMPNGTTLILNAGGNNIEAGLNGADNPLNGSAGIDYILGNAQGDTLVGNGGADVLLGGSGDDMFKYLALSDSSPGTSDTIFDFSPGNDKIDVSAIDADGATPGDPAFIFGGMTATANGVWFTEAANNTTVHFDTNNNTANDEMTIVLTGIGLGLTSSDFIL